MPRTPLRPVGPHLGPLLRWFPVWRRNLLVWRKLAIGSMLGNFGEPILYLLALGYGLGTLVGEVAGLTYITFLASGIICSSAMMTASFEGTYSAYSRMAVQKTWDAMVSSPLSVVDVVVGEIIWAATKSLLSVCAILVVAVALGVIDGWGALSAIPVAALTGFTFAAMAMIVTSVAKAYDFFLYYTTMVVTPMLLLSGVFFPLEQMPAAVQSLSQLMPLAHAIKVVRPLVTGAEVGHLALHLTVIAVWGLASTAIATWLIRRRMLV